MGACVTCFSRVFTHSGDYAVGMDECKENGK